MAQNRFPEDLIKLKQQQIRIFNRLALQPAAGTAELQSELTRLFCLIGSHPHWQGELPSSRSRVELYHQAVAAPGGESELVVEYRDGAFTVHAPASRRPSS
uniref:Uncharacterized protein n=1 Tax=Streptomyces sp. NBC_00049 TaxID=2903617 RepID=A0AAU2K1G7_9ACTN